MTPHEAESKALFEACCIGGALLAFAALISYAAIHFAPVWFAVGVTAFCVGFCVRAYLP